MRRPALALLLGCLLLVAGASALDGYYYYQTIEYAACDQEIYQQDIVIHRSTGTAYNETAGGLETWHIFVGEHCREDYGDVRFTNSTGELEYYLWPDYDSSSARFAVRLEGADEAGMIWVWHGNSAATSTSNATETYEFFEAFDSNLDQFTTGGKTNGVPEISGGALKIYQNPTSAHWGAYAATKIKFQKTAAISISFKYSKPAGYDSALRKAQSVWAVTDSATATRETNYYYTPTSGQALLWNNPANSATLTQTTLVLNGAGQRQVDGGSWIAITDWANVGSTYDLEFFNRDYTNYPCYFDDLVVRSYSAAPPAALVFSGEQSTAAPPIAAFTATPTAGLAPLAVQFTDTSAGRPTSWFWTFGDSGTSSTDQNPQHTYAAPGTYTVTLTATNEYGSDYELKTDYITVYGPITAQFTTNITGGTAPVTVQFTDTSTGGPTSWLWDFGDGTTSITQNPQHTYTTAGAHTVALTASHPYDSDTETKPAYITVAVLQPFPGLTNIPRDLAGNGLYTDINGNNRLDYNDLTVFFQHLAWAKTAQPIACFDFNGNGWLDYNDVITLFMTIMEEHT